MANSNDTFVLDRKGFTTSYVGKSKKSIPGYMIIPLTVVGLAIAAMSVLLSVYTLLAVGVVTLGAVLFKVFEKRSAVRSSMNSSMAETA